MARSKHTATKATGEPAPRVPLVVPKKRKAPGETTQPEGRRSTRIQETEAKAAKKKQKTSVVALEPGVDSDEEDLTADAVEVASSEDGHNECPRVICNRCITFPDNMDPDVLFTCPHCHFRPANAKGQQIIGPYYGFSNSTKPTLLLGGPTTRETFVLCFSPPLVVISLRLASVDPDGDSARTVFHNIAPYLPKRIKFVDLPYDLGSDKTFKQYTKNVETLVKRLKTGDLKEFRTFAVYLTDHTDPSRGDLHFTVNGKGAAKASEVMDQLFPSSLTDIFREGRQNSLTMLVCGAIMSVKDAYKDIKAFADEGYFAWIMAFGQPNMQPCLTNPLLQSASISWFIHRRQWDAVLDDLQTVGAHTDVYMLQKAKKTVRYVWSHPASKPYGEPAPYSCGVCYSYKSWGAPIDIKWASKNQTSAITHQCGYCKQKLEYRLKDTFIKHSKGNAKFSGRGEWYREYKEDV
ncbi:hypothetical protein FPV67DRAFT_1448677 [Lyophyllum atratum]|nr:hypothetical protein FPV67DRAFT_1450870 [Lyophyllum atratum]KAF8068801.1 hypothetical protein FPV67DRAFT_1448677 [Lyophyllum atratum]